MKSRISFRLCTIGTVCCVFYVLEPSVTGCLGFGKIERNCKPSNALSNVVRLEVQFYLFIQMYSYRLWVVG